MNHVFETRAVARILVGLMLAALLGGCAARAPHGDAAASEVTVRQSPNDDRSYRYLTLDNQLRVLLVSDPTTDFAAGSLNVMRGSLDEPAAYPGLAHFLEHMLFIGTGKYPEPDAYQQFVAAHGGQTNAYTAAENTNYFFQIQPEAFREGMDRLSRFFIDPLLDPAYVDREKNAVHSEYQLQLRDDRWRGQAAVKAVMNPEYPGSRFNIGNLETLGEGADKALVEFFESQYSADQMTLVALSNEPLDQMQAWVTPMFGAIANKNIGPAPDLPEAFDSSKLPARLNYQTEGNRYSVSYNFPIPSTDAYYRTKPARYLTNLLGHEGEGSLHERLKRQGWIESLAAGVNRLDHDNAFVSIDIELTTAGRQAIDQISAALFGYIDLLNKREPEAWRYREQAEVADLSFEYQEKSGATGFVYQVAPALGLYPPADVLIAPYLMDGFDASLIKHYLSFLTPDNVLIEVAGPAVATDQVERFFRVPYQLSARIDDLPDPDPGAMHLPARNPFLPEDLALETNRNIAPRLAVDAPGRELWLAEDGEFGVPRADQSYLLGLRGGIATERDLALASVYQQLVTDKLTTLTYPAMLAGLSYQIGVDAGGFRLTVSGFSDKQRELLEAVLEELVSVEVDPERFALQQRQLIREWQNFRFERPYAQTQSAFGNLILDTSFDPFTLADVLQGLQASDLVRWRDAMFKSVRVVGLAHGNINQRDLVAVSRMLEQHLQLADFELTRPRVTLIDDWRLEVDVDNEDASMVLYLQDDEASYRSRAASALAAATLQQGYFSSLRTEQQLGYLVSMSNRTIRDRGGLLFIIQSPVASPAELEQATVDYMATAPALLRDMDDELFERYKSGLISRLTEHPKNLRERTARYLADLEMGVTTFDSQQQIANIVATFSQAEIADYVERKVTQLDSHRLLVYNLGKFDDAPERGRLLAGPMALKKAAATSSAAR